MDTSNFDGVLILAEHAEFERDRSFGIDVLGRPCYEWVASALGEPVTVEPHGEENFLPLLPLGDLSAPVTAVFFSDTPLLSRRTVLEAVDTLIQSGKPCLRLARGWVFQRAVLNTMKELPRLERTYLSDEEDFLTARDFQTMTLVTETMRQRILSYYMSRGVQIIDPATTYIDGDVILGKNIVIYPGNTLRGTTRIGDGVILDTGNVIISSTLHSGVTVMSSRIEKSVIGQGSTVGPFANIRDNTTVGRGCRVGDFVELKATQLGDGSKAPHLAYLGNAEIGSGCNIGAGTITANYDGKRKFKTTVANHVFVGSNTTIVAPVTLSEGCFIAAGSTVTESVEKSALAIARARQVTYPEKSKW